MAVLMQYDAGQINDPVQWPRMTTRTVSEVFRRLQGSNTAVVQQDVLKDVLKVASLLAQVEQHSMLFIPFLSVNITFIKIS